MASFLPGPMAINVASYIGFLIKGWKGAVISFVAVLLPSFIIMVIFSHLYLNSRNIPGFSSFFDGVLPVVAAAAASVMKPKSEDSPKSPATIPIAFNSASVGVTFFHVSPS